MKKVMDMIVKIRKKTVGIVMVTAMALAFTGCGRDGSSSAKQTDTAASISFETVDLDGNTVKSEELFSKNKVTMINVWSTTCGPCVEEMPELEKLNKEFADKGGAVVGLVDNVPVGDDTYLEDAKSIVSDTGISYTNLRAWDGFSEVMPIVGTPTTFFADSRGNLIGESILGADPGKYSEQMEKLLRE